MNLKNYKSSCLRQKKEKEKRQLCRSGHGHKSRAFYEVFITTWFFFFFSKLKIPFDSFPLHGFDKKRKEKNLGAKTRFRFLYIKKLNCKNGTVEPPLTICHV